MAREKFEPPVGHAIYHIDPIDTRDIEEHNKKVREETKKFLRNRRHKRGKR